MMDSIPKEETATDEVAAQPGAGSLPIRLPDQYNTNQDGQAGDFAEFLQKIRWHPPVVALILTSKA